MRGSGALGKPTTRSASKQKFKLCIHIVVEFPLGSSPHINHKQNQIDISTAAGQVNQIKIFAQNSKVSFQKVRGRLSPNMMSAFLHLTTYNLHNVKVLGICDLLYIIADSE